MDSLNLENNVEYLFIDYFDTIVHRTVNEKTVKMIAENNFEKKVVAGYSAKDFFEARLASEETLKEKKNFENEYSYKWMIHEMYARLPKIWRKLSEEQFYQLHLNADIEAELSVQYLDPDTIDLLKKYKSKKIIIISDFYLPRVAFKEFLKKHNIDEYFNDIYVSSDIDKRKSNGSMYEFLKEKYNPDVCHMYGNNKKSDVIEAEKKGIKATLKKYKILDYIYPDRENITKKLDLMYKKNKKEVIFGGYSFYYYSFIELLYKRIVENNVKEVFFLSREGQFLKRLFDKYLCIVGNKEISTKYLYVSRMSTVAASLKDITKENFESIFDRYPNISIRDFLHTIGFNDKWIDDIQKHLVDIEIDKKIDKFESSKEFKKLIHDGLFKKIYDDNRTKQNELLREYIYSNVEYDTERLYFVDVGWKGTIQDAIFKSFDGKIKITGYYIGRMDSGYIHPNNIKEGLVFSKYPQESNYYSYFIHNTLLVEQIASADHGSTRGYKRESGVVKPIISKNDTKDYEVFQIVKNTQKYIENQFKEIFELFTNSVYSSSDFLDVLYKEYVKNILLLTRNERIASKKISKNTEFNFGVMNDLSGNDIQHKIKNVKKMLRSIVKGIFKRSKVTPLYSYKPMKQLLKKLKLTFIMPIAYYIIYIIEKKRFD